MISVLLTIISLTGNFLNCRKVRIGFILWIICDIGWAFVDFNNSDYSRMILDLVQLGFCIYGLYEWRDK